MTALWLFSDGPWEVSFKIYEELLEESEYAAWVAAFGIRPNHFTVNLNALKRINGISAFNQFLKDKGFILNSSGGEIKGSPEVLLEQSSTMAGSVSVAFTEGNVDIPGAYFEFARRYPDKNGELFQGFIAKSADKIFESTDLHSKDE